MNEFAVKDVRVNKNTVVDWYMFCREVCMAAVLKESEPLGGEGKIVEIDESMFGESKSNERGNLSVIKEWEVPGSVLISDCWKTYDCLSSHDGYQHLQVNHSLTFKDPETGAHTNPIEGTWSAIKRSLRNLAAHVEGEFDHYLAEYMWRRRRGHSLDDDVFENFSVRSPHCTLPWRKTFLHKPSHLGEKTEDMPTQRDKPSHLGDKKTTIGKFNLYYSNLGVFNTLMMSCETIPIDWCKF
ncbi:mitotic-spindle organizing protein 2A [Trichonephila clavipes]|nr:mitotic-spindle organizing protein 2A [Trichonephila clavipes]